MKKPIYQVALDDEIGPMLQAMADATQTAPEALIASLVREVLVDDARQHGEITGEATRH